MYFQHSRWQIFLVSNLIQTVLYVFHHVLQLRVKIQVENLMHFEKKVKSFDRFEISGNLENIKFVLKIVNQSTY